VLVVFEVLPKLDDLVVIQRGVNGYFRPQFCMCLRLGDGCFRDDLRCIENLALCVLNFVTLCKATLAKETAHVVLRWQARLPAGVLFVTKGNFLPH